MSKSTGKTRPIPDLKPTDKTVIVDPLAKAFPLMEKEEVEAFLADVEKNGIREPVTVVIRDGNTIVLDGRHRWTAAVQLRKTCPAREIVFDEDSEEADKLAFVCVQNFARRNLTPHQRAMTAVEVWSIQTGNRPNADADEYEDRKHRGPNGAPIAALACVSIDTANRAIQEVWGKAYNKSTREEPEEKASKKTDESIHTNSEIGKCMYNGKGEPEPEPAPVADKPCPGQLAAPPKKPDKCVTQKKREPAPPTLKAAATAMARWVARYDDALDDADREAANRLMASLQQKAKKK